MIDGLLNINKPPGITSFQVVALVRRLSGERKVGHAGTLDPDASGVLPLALGQGTRVVAFLAEAHKTYWAQIELGSATDTYDASGRVVSSGDASAISQQHVAEALALFRGPISQTPPPYSAVKHRGQPLYRLARAGVEVPHKPRQVHIFRLDLREYHPPLLTIEVGCSKGTYIRSLAHDLGERLGCGAHLKKLIRLQSGPFHIDDAVALATLEEHFARGDWLRFLHPPDVALAHLPAVTVGEGEERELRNGRPWPLEELEKGSLYRAYSRGGHLIALIRFDTAKRQWRPEKVFSGQPTSV